MFRLSCLFISLLLVVSTNTNAFEPVLDQQGMVYFNLSFDTGQSTKSKHEFGFRFDRGLVEPGDNMTIGQLADKPAVFNLKMNSEGLQSFELNGIDYSKEYYVHNGAETDEGEETAADSAEGAPVTEEPQPIPEAETRRKIDIPLGVIVGAIIGGVAIAGSGK